MWEAPPAVPPTEAPSQQSSPESLAQQAPPKQELSDNKCGHVTPEECAAADYAALMGRDDASARGERAPRPAFFMRTREATQCSGTTLVDLPPCGGPNATHNTHAVYWAEGHDRHGTYKIIRKLWHAGFMLPGASILVAAQKGVYVALDAGDEQVDAFDAALKRHAWAWPGWTVRAAPFAGGDWSNAEKLGCGTHDTDELPASGGAP